MIDQFLNVIQNAVSLKAVEAFEEFCTRNSGSIGDVKTSFSLCLSVWLRRLMALLADF